MKLKHRIIRLFIIFTTTALLFTQNGFVIAARVPKDDLEAINRDSVHHKLYDNETGCGNGGLIGGPNTGLTSDGSIWSSGIKPPYILEQYAIETLKAIAKKRNVPEANTVTQEHIDALLAFMFGEGGDIANRWLFNPLNTGISAEELIDGPKKGDGTQSFKSFDAGVEATARTMVGRTQSRLADVLIQKDSTAAQFMYALTYFKKFPGNAFWAAASLPNPDSYYNSRINLVNQIRKNYIDVASTVLGTPAREFTEKIRNTAGLRSQTNPHTGASVVPLISDGAGSLSCTSPPGDVASANNIVQKALNFSWPEKHNPPKTPKPEYAEAISSFNSGQRADGADCGVFVATVMRASGADSSYPAIGTAVQRDYVRNNPDKYFIIENPKSSADLLPGDVLVVNNGARHHTLIYVGPQGGANNYDIASASQDSRTATLGKLSGEKDLSIYTVARLK